MEPTAVISNLTREALFHAIAEALHRVVPFDRSGIFLHDPTRDVLRLVALESSLPSSHYVVGLEMASGETNVGWVLEHQQPLLRRDLTTSAGFPLRGGPSPKAFGPWWWFPWRCGGGGSAP